VTELIKALSRHKLVRYAFAGSSALLTEEVGLWVCYGQLGMPLWLATTIAFGSAFGVNFTLNRFWTFADDGAREGAVHAQTFRFAILVGINYCVTQAIMYLLTSIGVNYLVAKALSTMFITIYNFYVYKKWVFKAPAAPAEGAAGHGTQSPADSTGPASRIRA
jgi:putative flippase GtrA